MMGEHHHGHLIPLGTSRAGVVDGGGALCRDRMLPATRGDDPALDTEETWLTNCSPAHNPE